MNIDKLITQFPEAMKAIEQGKDWVWEPKFADGYPCPSNEKDQWKLVTYYVGFVVQSGEAFITFYEMTPKGERNQVGLMELTKESDQEVGVIILKLIHYCWMMTKTYLNYVSATMEDPLMLVDGVLHPTRKVIDQVIEAHWKTPNGDYEQWRTTDESAC